MSQSDFDLVDAWHLPLQALVGFYSGGIGFALQFMH